MSDRFNLDGRVALITGGGTGIGRGSALVLAEHGAAIVLAGRRAEPLESTAKEIDAFGRRALAVPMDVTDADSCRQLVETTRAEFGRVDILVNCAGGAVTQSIFKWSDEDFDNVLDLNFKAAWHLSRAVAKPMMEQGKGAIVNISSGARLGDAARRTLRSGQGGDEQSNGVDGCSVGKEGNPRQCRGRWRRKGRDAHR